MKVYSGKDINKIHNNVMKQYRAEDFNNSLTGAIIAGAVALLAIVLIYSLAIILLPENKLNSAFSLTANEYQIND